MSFESDLASPQVTQVRAVELWALVRYHILLIIFATAVGIGLGYLNFIRTPPVFESRLQLLVLNESKNGAAPFQGAEGSVAATRERPHALLIATAKIAEKALDKKILDESDTKSNTRLRDINLFSGLKSPALYIVSRLTARARVEGGSENHDILNLTFRSPDPVACKAVLEAVAESYKDFLGDTQSNLSEELLQLIENAKDSISDHLRSVSKEYNEFRQNMPLMAQDGKAGPQTVNPFKLRMSDIEAKRTELRIVINQRQAEFASIQKAIANGASRESIALMFKSMRQETQSPSATPELVDKTPASEMFKLLVKRQLLLEDLGEDHPKVKLLQKEIEMTQNFYQSEKPPEEKAKPPQKSDFVSVCIDALRYEINSLENQVMQLDMAFEDERQNAKAISGFEDKNEFYQKEIQRTDDLYHRVIKRLDEINYVRDFGGYKTSVLTPARIGAPVSPIFNQYLMVGAFCGAAVGFGIAYLMEANDRTFHSPEEVSQQLGLPVVGHVAVIRKEDAGGNSKSGLNGMLVTVHKPKSSVSEAYRGIRSSIYFSTRGEQHKVIQVTSPNPGDGKTTLCANLAVSIAQSGKKVLIIDADFRRPKIHEYFGLDKSIGMSSVIAGEAELPDAIQATDVENLWGLPCGPRPNNPSELLTTRRFEELLDVLREQYDFVMIDTPPLLAVTDPGAVAARVDGVIMTIRLSKRTRREAMRAREMLTDVGANVLGVVINGSVNQGGYGYGRYSGYYGVYQYRYGNGYAYEANDNNPAASPSASAETGRRRRQRS